MTEILNATLAMVVAAANSTGGKNMSCHGTGSASAAMKSGGGGHHHHHHHGSLGDDDNSTDTMIMYFHGGFRETILFDFWRTNSAGVFVISCLVLFILAAMYEGLKFLREVLIQREIRKQNLSQMRNGKAPNSNKNDCCHNSNNGNAHEEKLVLSHEDDSMNAIRVDELKSKQASNLLSNTSCNCPDEKSTRIVFQEYSSRLLSTGHLTQTLLHMAQITLSYLLMLVFMTYNSWLCLAVVLGAGLGYFLFGLKRLTTIDVNEHCH